MRPLYCANFAEKGVFVFNPTTEFQKVEASTSSYGCCSAGLAGRARRPLAEALHFEMVPGELTAAFEADIPVVLVFAGDFCSNRQIGLWVDGDFS